MSTYYDSRSRSPRPNGSASSYSKPEAASKLAADNGTYARDSNMLSVPKNDSRGRGTSRSRSPNSRNTYPPLLQPDARATSRSHRSRSRRRETWPPAPVCEDEAASMAREAGSGPLSSFGADEAVVRGAIDQEPVVEDVILPSTKPEKATSTQKTTRGVPKDSKIPTPPTSDDETVRKVDRGPSKLNMNLEDLKNEVPELSKRTSTPYAFSKEASRNAAAPPAQTLSPEALLSPPPTNSRNRIPNQSTSKSLAGTPVREASGRTRSAKGGDDYFSLSSGETTGDDTAQLAGSASTSSRSKQSTYPPPRPHIPTTGTQTEAVDFAPPTGLAPPRRRNLDARRNTDIESTMSRPMMDKTRRPTPLMTSSLSSDTNDSTIYASPLVERATLDIPISQFRNVSCPTSRKTSPSSSVTGHLRNPTPPESPRNSAEFVRESSIDSSPASRAGSRSGSRPASPSPRTPLDAARFPKTDLDWSAVLAANSARRSKPAPRVSAIRQDSVPTSARDDKGQYPVANRASTLPYPVDDGRWTPTIMMPSEQRHQFYPDPRPAMQAPIMQEPKPLSRSTTPTLGSLPSSYSRPIRPSFQSRHSAADLPSMEKQQPREIPRVDESKRVSSFNNPSQAKKDLPVLLKKGLPNCTRTQPAACYTDWYCLTTSPSLDFCPDCIDHIERTAFRLSFRKSPPRSSDTRVVCALGGMPWIRLAWLLTLQRKRTNLRLLEDIAKIEETTDPCPGDQHAVLTWYGLKDRDGYFVQDFGICYSDVKKIELLLPGLDQTFVPLPRRISLDKRLCAIRPKGSRFSDYLDSLIAAHEQAVSSRRMADTTSFIELVKKKQRLRECAKDAQFLNHLWHFIPSVPELTVCEECFETVVEPEIKKAKSLAMQFNRTVQPVYGEGPGVSCQLYSHRMRRIFQRALQDNDVRYLAKKAQERRQAEIKLQNKYQDVMRKAKRLSREGSSGAEDEERRLDREVRRITEDWQIYE